jgi:hypothetical protein
VKVMRIDDQMVGCEESDVMEKCNKKTVRFASSESGDRHLT